VEDRNRAARPDDIESEPRPTAGSGHLAPTITRLGTLSELTLGSDGGFQDVVGGDAGGTDIFGSL